MATKRKSDILSTIMDGIGGGLAISFGVTLSTMVYHPAISPIIFSVGILICIQFKLGLITKEIPSGSSLVRCGIIFATNIIVALILGLGCDLYGFQGPAEGYLPILLGGYFTGIIIGIVALANKYGGPYTTLITMILMWTFVYLKLPHCVVYAFWLGGGKVRFVDFILVTLGNVFGGSVIRSFGWTRWLQDKLCSSR